VAVAVAVAAAVAAAVYVKTSHRVFHTSTLTTCLAFALAFSVCYALQQHGVCVTSVSNTQHAASRCGSSLALLFPLPCQVAEEMD